MDVVKIDGIEIPIEKLEDLGWIAPSSRRYVWLPKLGESYYYDDSFGESQSAVWIDSITCHSRRRVGNVFKTDRELRDNRDKRVATIKVLNKISQIDGGERGEENLWLPEYNKDIQEFDIIPSFNYQGMPTEWEASYEAWTYIIKKMEEELKTVFGIL